MAYFSPGTPLIAFLTPLIDELHEFGLMIQQDIEKEQMSIIPSNMKLAKTPMDN